jgi:hypothetical protein
MRRGTPSASTRSGKLDPRDRVQAVILAHETRLIAPADGRRDAAAARRACPPRPSA